MDSMPTAAEQAQQRTRDLIIGLVLSIGIGIVVTVTGFIGTVIYLLTSGHLHAADRSAADLYLIAPGLGLLVAASGCTLAIRKWRRGADDGREHRTVKDGE